MPGRGFGQRARKLARIVGENAEIGHDRAETFQQRAQQITVGVENRRAAARRARLDHFVAGRKYRHLQPPPHLDVGDAERGQKRNMLRFQHGAGRQHDAALRHVLAGKPPVGAELQAFRHRHAVAVGGDIFLHEHGVGAGRHRRAGENADRLLRSERDIGARAGGQTGRRLPRSVSPSAARSAWRTA